MGGAFWNAVTQILSIYEWWQGLIYVVVCMITFFIGKYWRNIFIWIGKKFVSDYPPTLQYRMFWGLINDAINIRAKDEIRRCFSENGFHNTTGQEFSLYVKNESNVIIDMIKDHIINLYPPTNTRMSVSMQEVLNFLKTEQHAIEDTIFEIFVEAKRLKKYEIEKFIEIEEKFVNEINMFVDKNTSDCKNCLIILFGKREIAENKKDRIKTLKAQMNFAEQKLSDIQSEFLAYYSEKINMKNT